MHAKPENQDKDTQKERFDKCLRQLINVRSITCTVATHCVWIEEYITQGCLVSSSALSTSPDVTFTFTHPE